MTPCPQLIQVRWVAIILAREQEADVPGLIPHGQAVREGTLVRSPAGPYAERLVGDGAARIKWLVRHLLYHQLNLGRTPSRRAGADYSTNTRHGIRVFVSETRQS